MRPLKNGNLCSSSRKAKILTGGIHVVFRGLKFEPDAEIGHKVPFCKGFVNTTTLPQPYEGNHEKMFTAGAIKPPGHHYAFLEAFVFLSIG